MNVGSVASLADALGQNFAGTDHAANRIRTDEVDGLRRIAMNRLKQSRGLSESLSAQGMVHSGVNLQGQADIGQQADTARAQLTQGNTDRLNALARQRIQEQTQFKINSLLPG